MRCHQFAIEARVSIRRALWASLCPPMSSCLASKPAPAWFVWPPCPVWRTRRTKRKSLQLHLATGSCAGRLLTKTRGSARQSPPSAVTASWSRAASFPTRSHCARLPILCKCGSQLRPPSSFTTRRACSAGLSTSAT
eukprot:Amastigsp_a844115_116.p4 type:complete len:137 gc:universal Amastigsp_a844115_116:1269-1679(+)